MFETSRWFSSRLNCDVTLNRWGHAGQPVLMFPTAGGDAGEIDRFLMIRVLEPLLAAGRIKMYSCDSVAGRVWFNKEGSAEHRMWMTHQFHQYIKHEVVPAIRTDCRSPDMGIWAVGSSIGAFHAVAVTCRFPDMFHRALGMSGTYNLMRFIERNEPTDYFHVSSPLHFVPHLAGRHLDVLRTRHIHLASGEGKWEDISESFRMAKILGDVGIPNWVDSWGKEWDHDWVTWRAKMPAYLDEWTTPEELIMDDTREHKTTTGELVGDERRRFMRTLLTELRALERMLAEGMFERGVARIGSEQEMFLVDRSYHAAPAALKVLEKLGDPHYTTELGLFNLELNADPQPFAGKGLAQMEAQLNELYTKVQRAASDLDVQPVLTGILPTLGKTDLSIANMVPNPRYLTLNRVMTAARGEGYDISIKGLDELVAKHDSLMFEACNASFQVHLQVAEPERFGHAYDIAQLLLAPALALGTNSPTLFGKRLWAETRIALFEQSCDIRTPSLHARDRAARVSFGKGWVKGSVLEIFKDNVTRFRPLVGTEHEEDALAVLDRGGVPDLKALRLHNGTIYRWNRACYGISENGKPHLRIELRVLPSGPTIVDEVANAAFWLGLMSELSATLEDMPARMDFDHAQANFYAAARDGLAARFTWLDSEEVIAQPFILDKLLPLAEAGLARAKVDDKDAKKYLGIIEERVRTLRTGSRWALRSLSSMKARGSQGERQTALVAATIARQAGGRPVVEWERARLDEIYGSRTGYNRVSQYMQTDLLTVQPDDPVELVADFISWERIRHVPVEDASGKLVGLVTSRAVLRHFASLAKKRAIAPNEEVSVSVSDIMRRDLLTVTPDTLTVDAIAIMRRQRVGCLPVVQDGHIVALITEEDFMGIAADLLDERIGQVEPPHEHPKSRRRP